LVRTQTWTNRAGTYRQAAGKNSGVNYIDHTITTYTRNIQAFNHLRPIPQGQIDALDMSATDKANYQNFPGISNY